MTPRGGTVPIRDPAALALLGTPFDNFAYTADVKPAIDDARHVNLPNLAVFLWRLAAYRLPLVQPLAKGVTDLGLPQPPGLARFAVRFDLHPLDCRCAVQHQPPWIPPAGTSGGVIAPLTEADAVPGPMLDARLTSGHRPAIPTRTSRVDFFDDAGDAARPASTSATSVCTCSSRSPRSRCCCPPPTWMAIPRRQPVRLGNRIASAAPLTARSSIDPDIGRRADRSRTTARRGRLVDCRRAPASPRIYASFTYGAAGPVGAHPVDARFRRHEPCRPICGRSARCPAA